MNATSMNKEPSDTSMRRLVSQPWFWAWAVAICTFPLIWLGGLVTTHDAGMAVPDWPGTYGYNLFLYPWSTWLFGPFDLLIEHGHRQLGAIVGLLSIALCVVATWSDNRKWFRRCCYGLLIAIIVQGLLGGFRVLIDARTLAMVHGCGGPLVFAFATLIAIASSSDWQKAPQFILGKWVRRVSWLLLVFAIIQLFVGAQLRHTVTDTAPIFFMATVHTHLTMATLLTLLILLLGVLVRTGNYRSERALRRPANALLLILIVQVFLGFSTWIVNYAMPWENLNYWLASYVIQAQGYWESWLVTAHQATGSLIIAFSVWMVCRIERRQAKLAGIA